MQDPSYGVPPQLLPHVHLVSSMPFPTQLNQMAQQMVIHYLKSAPNIMREMRSVRWEYWQPPPDGSVRLCWQPLNQLGDTFASDGYVWGEPENEFQLQIEGHVVQAFVYNTGYIAGREQVAAHRRTRYRLVSAPNNQPTDHSFELVHYSQALPDHRLPVNRVAPKPTMQQTLMTRSYLDNAGPIERKEFMFPDPGNWPRLNMPAQRMPPNPYQNQMMGRPGMPPVPGHPGMQQPMYNQPQAMRPGAPVGPSPAKRQRQMPPGPIPRPVGEIENPILAEEEMAAAGDFLDLMSPRELSTVRFKQHHEWMEEILASPYGTTQITPVRIDFQLGGELGAITKEILEPTKDDDHTGPGLSAAKVAELERRVQQYQAQSEAQILELTKTHEQRMRDMQQQRGFAKLERELADATRHGHDNAATIAQVVRAVEAQTRCTIAPLDDVVRVAKGGLLKPGEENVGNRTEVAAHAPLAHGGGGGGGGAGLPAQDATPADLDVLGGPDPEALVAANDDDFADFANLDTAGEALQDFYTNSYDTMDFQPTDQ